MEWNKDMSAAPRDGTVFWGLWDNCGKVKRTCYVYATRASKFNQNKLVSHLAESLKYKLIAWKHFKPGDEKLNLSKHNGVVPPPVES